MKNQDWASVVERLFDTKVEVTDSKPGSVTFKLLDKNTDEFEKIFNEQCRLGFKGSLQYEVSSSIQKNLAVQIDPKSYDALGHLSGAEILLRISQHPRLKEIGFNPQYVAENFSFKQENSNFLVSNTLKSNDEESKTVISLHVASFKRLLTHIPIPDLASLLTNPKGEGLKGYNLPKDIQKNPVLEAAFSQFCGSTKEGQFYFDADAFMAYLKAPVLQLSKTESNVFTLNSDDFLRFLAARVPEKFIVSGTGSEKGEHLIFFAPPQETARVRLPKNLSIMIDCSGSMQGVFENAIKKAEELIENFSGSYKPEDMPSVNIVAFSSLGSYSKKTFDLTKKNSLEDIKSHLKTLSSSGGTYLEGSLLKQLENVEDFQDKHSVIVMFTDGQDTDTSPYEKRELQNAINTLSHQNKKPNIFVLGLDGYDKALANDLVQRTGGELIEVEKENLQKIIESLSSEKFKKNYLHFNIESKKLKQLFLPVESGSVKKSDFFVPIGEKFTVNQVDYTVTHRDLGATLYKNLWNINEIKPILSVVERFKDKINIVYKPEPNSKICNLDRDNSQGSVSSKQGEITICIAEANTGLGQNTLLHELTHLAVRTIYPGTNPFPSEYTTEVDKLASHIQDLPKVIQEAFSDKYSKEKRYYEILPRIAELVASDHTAVLKNKMGKLFQFYNETFLEACRNYQPSWLQSWMPTFFGGSEDFSDNQIDFSMNPSSDTFLSRSIQPKFLLTSFESKNFAPKNKNFLMQEPVQDTLQEALFIPNVISNTMPNTLDVSKVDIQSFTNKNTQNTLKQSEQPCFVLNTPKNDVENALIPLPICKEIPKQQQQDSSSDSFVSSVTSSITEGAKNGFIYNYLFKLLTNDNGGMKESEARLAAEAVVAAGLFTISPAGALIYVGLQHAPFERLGIGKQASSILSSIIPLGQAYGAPITWLASTAGNFVGGLVGNATANLNISGTIEKVTSSLSYYWDSFFGEQPEITKEKSLSVELDKYNENGQNHIEDRNPSKLGSKLVHKL